MADLTIQELDDEVLRRLRDRASERRQSLDTLVRELLARSVGLDSGVEVFDDLNDLAGSWTEDDERAFLDGTRPFREVDESSWG